jgi:hypothetical protein
MGSTQKTAFIFTASLCLNVSFLSAQIAGNPVRTVDKREWTMGLSGNYLNQEMGPTTAVSRRILVKSAFGVDRWLSLYGLFGTVQLSMNRKLPGVHDYRDRFRFGYGAGLQVCFDLNPAAEKSPGFWGGLQVLKFVSEGTFTTALQFQGSELIRRFDLKYDCGEMTLCGGLLFPIGKFTVYGGAAGWATSRTDTKKEYLVDNTGSKQYRGQAIGDFESGLWSGGILGVEYMLPQRVSVSIEAMAFNKNNYQIMVGICQTGSPEW